MAFINRFFRLESERDFRRHSLAEECFKCARARALSSSLYLSIYLSIYLSLCLAGTRFNESRTSTHVRGAFLLFIFRLNVRPCLYGLFSIADISARCALPSQQSRGTINGFCSSTALGHWDIRV